MTMQTQQNAARSSHIHENTRKSAQSDAPSMMTEEPSFVRVTKKEVIELGDNLQVDNFNNMDNLISVRNIQRAAEKED